MLSENLSSKLDLPTDELPMSSILKTKSYLSEAMMKLFMKQNLNL